MSYCSEKLPDPSYPRPPVGGSSVNKPCEHKFIYLRQQRETDKDLNSSSMTKQVDVFFCEKCLEIRKIDC